MWECQLWEFWDFHLGVLGQNAIWMWPLWRSIEYNIREKVVASPKSGPCWVLWVRVCPWCILAPKVLQLCTDQLVVWFVQVCASEWLLVILFNPILELQHALLPPKCYEPKSVSLIPYFFVVFISDSHLNLSRSLGAHQLRCIYFPNQLILWQHM